MIMGSEIHRTVMDRLEALEAVVFCNETQRTLLDALFENVELKHELRKAQELAGTMLHNDVAVESQHVLEVSELEAKCNGLSADCSFLREENGKQVAKILDLEAQRDILWGDREALSQQVVDQQGIIKRQADVIKELETGLKEVEVLRKTAFTQDTLIDRQAERITHYIYRVDELEVSYCTRDDYVASCTNLVEAQKVVAELRSEIKELETQRFTNAKKLNLQAYQINELREKCGLKDTI